MNVKIYSKKFGFTIIELLIACAIVGIVVIGVGNLYIGMQRIFINQAKISELQHQMRVAMNIMIKDIRRAGYDPKGLGNFGITEKLLSEIRYTIDENENGIVDPVSPAVEPKEEHRFRLDGNILKYTKDATVDEVTESVSWHSLHFLHGGEVMSLQFIYRDKDGVVTTTAADVRTVHITITGRTKLSAAGDMHHSQTLNSRVKVRNLSD